MKGLRDSLVKRPRSQAKLDQDLSIYIFSTSAAMLGVCLTAIGLLQISHRIKLVSTLGDDLLAIDSIIFLLACVLAYFGLRTRSTRQTLKERLESIADVCFLLGLCAMAAACLLITYEFV